MFRHVWLSLGAVIVILIMCTLITLAGENVHTTDSEFKKLKFPLYEGILPRVSSYVNVDTIDRIDGELTGMMVEKGTLKGKELLLMDSSLVGRRVWRVTVFEEVIDNLSKAEGKNNDGSRPPKAYILLIDSLTGGLIQGIYINANEVNQASLRLDSLQALSASSRKYRGRVALDPIISMQEAMRLLKGPLDYERSRIAVIHCVRLEDKSYFDGPLWSINVYGAPPVMKSPDKILMGPNRAAWIGAVEGGNNRISFCNYPLLWEIEFTD